MISLYSLVHKHSDPLRNSILFFLILNFKIAVHITGELFAWGMGDNGQLGTGEEEDLNVPTLMK
jgi:hypothetical protein